MLTSLLPGLRDLRAPLSAGAIWLLSIWFVAEPSVPDLEGATGIVASAYRLGGLLSAIGLGTVLAFAAYLVGSLSVFVFSGPLRGAIHTSPEARDARLDGLSGGGREALEQVARDSRQRLEEILSLSGYGVDDVLRGAARPPREPDGKIAPARRRGWRRARPRRPPRAAMLTATSSVPATPQVWQERELASLVVRDLEVIADAQLLGRENDVFSAVDRTLAEVDFRIAVIPALLALTACLAVRQPSVVLGVAVVLVGATTSVGLMLDAARQQRKANDLLLNLLEHGRVSAPSLTRLEARATDLADQSPAKVVSRQASATLLAIQALIASLESVPDSATVPGLGQALDAAVAARGEFERLQAVLRELGSGDASSELDSDLLQRLEGVVRGWATLNRGVLDSSPKYRHLLPAEHDPAPSSDELVEQMRRARADYPSLAEELRGRILAIRAQEAAARSLPADG